MGIKWLSVYLISWIWENKRWCVDDEEIGKRGVMRKNFERISCVKVRGYMGRIRRIERDVGKWM